MSIVSFLSRPLAAWTMHQQRQWSQRPVATQQRVLKQLLHQAQNTVFGQEHHFSAIQTYADFKAQVPIRDYEALVPYIDKIKAGTQDVLWPGRPIYFSETSGTTSGKKHIPITQASLPHHLQGARNALLSYIHHTGQTSFLSGRMMFLSGSPVLGEVGGIATGRLSGLVNHHVPAYLRHRQLPSYETNCMADWEAKIEAIVEETLRTKLTLLSGIPPWIQMYLDKLQKRTGRPAGETLSALSLLVHGGVNFAPYRTKLFDTLGRSIDTVETYPASEGFIAFQDSPHSEGLLLQLDSGIFFEFIPTHQYFDAHPPRLCIEEVELGVDYTLVLNTNAGLWGYALGDTVKFVSKAPYRVVMTGRVKHFISAFGEHVIAEEVDHAMQTALTKHATTRVTEFTVAPKVSKQQGTASYHEWLIEFTHPPQSMAAFAHDLDMALRQRNSYYRELVMGQVLQPLRITPLKQGSFQAHMRKAGKLGGQNKVVRLANDRLWAEALLYHQV